MAAIPLNPVQSRRHAHAHDGVGPSRRTVNTAECIAVRCLPACVECLPGRPALLESRRVDRSHRPGQREHDQRERERAREKERVKEQSDAVTAMVMVYWSTGLMGR